VICNSPNPGAHKPDILFNLIQLHYTVTLLPYILTLNVCSLIFARILHTHSSEHEDIKLLNLIYSY